jgi:recombinational DNA repair protein RecT
MNSPQQTVTSLALVRSEINKRELSTLVDHPFVIGQLSTYFGNSEKAISIIKQFKINYMVLVSDPDIKKTLEGCDHFSMVQSLIALSKDNLSINPSDKESCIVKFGGKAVAIPMWRGKVKRMQEKGIIRYINYFEIRYSSDGFIDKGNGKFVHYKKEIIPEFCLTVNNIKTFPSENGTILTFNELNAKPTLKKVSLIKTGDIISDIKGNKHPVTKISYEPNMLEVLMEVIMPDGRPRYKRVSNASILKRQAKSKMQNIWNEWPEEMWKKTAIGIFENEIGVRTPQFAEHIEEEEEEFEQEQTQESNVTDVTTPEEVTEAEVIEEQDILLRSKLDELKEQLGQVTRDRLELTIDSLNNEQLQASINGIQEWLDGKSNPEPKNDSPI